MVVRIMVMVPLYAISSLISLFSVEAAFVIDAIRDIYEVSICVLWYSIGSAGFGSLDVPNKSPCTHLSCFQLGWSNAIAIVECATD